MILFKKRNKTDERKKVILLDEIPAYFLFESQSINEAFDFDWDSNIFLVGCISPIIEQRDEGFKLKLKKIDEENLLETKNIIFSQLDITYSNSYQIQLFYNVFLAHYNQLSKSSIYNQLSKPRSNNLSNLFNI